MPRSVTLLVNFSNHLKVWKQLFSLWATQKHVVSKYFPAGLICRPLLYCLRNKKGSKYFAIMRGGRVEMNLYSKIGPASWGTYRQMGWTAFIWLWRPLSSHSSVALVKNSLPCLSQFNLDFLSFVIYIVLP